MKLFEQNRHEKIFGKKWDLARVEDFIVEIFDSIEVGFEEGSFWRQHPDDAINNWHEPFMDFTWGLQVSFGGKNILRIMVTERRNRTTNLYLMRQN